MHNEKGKPMAAREDYTDQFPHEVYRRQQFGGSIPPIPPRRMLFGARPGCAPCRKVLAVFGSRTEVIRLAPVLRCLEEAQGLGTRNVCAGRHTDLLPLFSLFGVRVHFDLGSMQLSQQLPQLCSRIVEALRPVLIQERPDAILVQGESVAALAGALAGFLQAIPVGHVGAGVRQDTSTSSLPEEMNRRLMGRIADWHFAATPLNMAALRAEGVDEARVFLTGNPLVDSLQEVRPRALASPAVRDLLMGSEGLRRVVLAIHRHEDYGDQLAGILSALRGFVDAHPDVLLLFPVLPTPDVRGLAHALLSGHARVRLLEPLGYLEFVGVMAQAWLIVSDSGTVQEETASLGKPLLMLGEKMTLPDAVDAGVARVVGTSPQRLCAMLEEAYYDDAWFVLVRNKSNLFGKGDSGVRVVQALVQVLTSLAQKRAAA
jgi:UDP-N-acetylglucosamine 2-epimerase (non-hydrolysing)